MIASPRLEKAALAQSLVDRMPGSGFLVVDSALRIAVMDGDIYADYSGCVGRRVPDVIPATAWQVLGPRYRAALDGHVQSFDYEAVGGASVYAVRIAPIRDGAEVIGVMVLTEDITLSVATIKRLTESEDRLRAAHAVARLASWEWRPETDEMEIFEALPGDEALTGTKLPLEVLLEQIPPGERPETREDLGAIARGDRDDTVRLSSRVGPGGPGWVETRSRAVRDDSGRVLCVRGTTQDVTEQELAKQEAADARDFFQATLDSLSAHIAVIDDRGDIVMTNRAWDAFAAANDGTRASAGGNYLEACDGAEADELASEAAAGLRAIIAGERRELSLEYPCHSPTAERWFVLRAARFDGSGNARVVISHENVTERRQAESQVATQAALLDEVDVAVVAAGPGGRITHWNRAAERLFGWTRVEALGRDSAELISLPGRAEVADFGRSGDRETQLTVCRKDGSTFPASLHSRDMVDADGLPAGRITVSVDVSERVASERALLAGRNYMQAVADSIGEGLITLDTEGRVIYMNDAAGELLGWPSEALQGQVLHHVVHSHRPDGSEMPLEDRPAIQVRGDGRTGVDDDVFFRRDGRPLPVSYTASPFETEDGVEGCVVVFAEISERKAHEEDLQREADKLAWIGRIQDALAEDRFVLHAQPIVDLGTHEVVQAELLLRMRAPDGELVGPGSFLPVAEQYGLIGDIDRWVIEHGVSIAATGRPVEINLSAHSIGDEAVFDHIEACINDSGADPAGIVFEITETAIVADEAAASRFAARLRSLGCKLALDDFGTGYGGFTYLKQLPIDFLKIDIQFVHDLTTNPGSRHVVEAVVGLAKGFSLRTVAEGVEDAETYELLLELGVDFAQGYHIGRPGPLTSTDLDNIEPTGDVRP